MAQLQDDYKVLTEKLLIYMEKIRTLKSEREQLRTSLKSQKEKVSQQQVIIDEEQHTIKGLETRLQKIENEKGQLDLQCLRLQTEIDQCLAKLQEDKYNFEKLSTSFTKLEKELHSQKEDYEASIQELTSHLQSYAQKNLDLERVN